MVAILSWPGFETQPFKGLSIPTAVSHGLDYSTALRNLCPLLNRIVPLSELNQDVEPGLNCSSSTLTLRTGKNLNLNHRLVSSSRCPVSLSW